MKPPKDDEIIGRTSSPARATDTRRILLSVAAPLVLIHLAQSWGGSSALVAVVAYAAAAAWLVGWRMDVLRSVRTAVLLLVALSLACVLGTLTVQRSQLGHASDDEFRATVAFAWAHLVIKVTHPLPGDVDLDERVEDHLDQQERLFGAEYAADERDKAIKAARAAADETAGRALAEKHAALFDGLYRAASGLGFTDLFHSWWFNGLFYVLCLNLVLGAVVRRRLSLRNLGFHGAHLGLVLVVGGATVGAFRTERGFVALQVGAGEASFRTADGETRDLGYTIRLDAFETLYHADLTVEVSEGDANPHHAMGGVRSGPGASRTIKLTPGRTFPVTDPESGVRYEVTLEEIGEGYGVLRSFEAAGPGEPGGAVLQLIGLAPDGPVWVRGQDTPYLDPAGRFRLWIGGPDDPAPSVCTTDRPGGRFTLTLPGEEPVTAAVEVGTELQVGGFRATIRSIIPDFRVGAQEVPADAFPRNPAARVLIRDERGEGEEVLFFADPELKGFSQLPWSGVQASFDFDFWCGPAGGPQVALRVTGTDRVSATRAADPDAAPSPIGAGEPVPGLATELTVLQALPDGAEKLGLVLEPSSEDAVARPAVRLGIEGGETPARHWLLADSSLGSIRLGPAAGSPEITLASNRQRPPRDWRSHVTFLEEGQPVLEGDIEVNEPICYRGYCFFQSDADASRPDYSGLQVVRDPAWPLVGGGLWLLLLGISWCFYVQPLFDRRAAARREGGSR